MNQIEYFKRQEQIQMGLLEEMEESTERLKSIKRKVNKIEDKILAKLTKAIDEGEIPPYKAAIAYSKLIDGITKMEKTRLDVYDRVSGTTISGGESAEESDAKKSAAGKSHDPEVVRVAENILMQIVGVRKKTTPPPPSGEIKAS